MTRFWKYKSDKPLVWGHSGWYYSIEYYGMVSTFIDIEELQKLRNAIAARKISSPRSWYQDSRFSLHPRLLFRKHGLSLWRYHLRQNYIILRHQKEIVEMLDQAYLQFSSEQPEQLEK